VPRFIETISEVLQSWGLTGLRPGLESKSRIEAFLDLTQGRLGVGQLWQEAGEFVFAYLPSFVEQNDVPPISAFPDKGQVYRSRQLWPFFQVRLPPTTREDVRRVLRERGVGEGDVLGRLAAIGGRVASSPYRLEWTGNGQKFAAERGARQHARHEKAATVVETRMRPKPGPDSS